MLKLKLKLKLAPFLAIRISYSISNFTQLEPSVYTYFSFYLAGILLFHAVLMSPVTV